MPAKMTFLLRDSLAADLAVLLRALGDESGRLRMRINVHRDLVARWGKSLNLAEGGETGKSITVVSKSAIPNPNWLSINGPRPNNRLSPFTLPLRGAGLRHVQDPPTRQLRVLRFVRFLDAFCRDVAQEIANFKGSARQWEWEGRAAQAAFE